MNSRHPKKVLAKAKDAVLIIKLEIDNEANATVSSPSELRQRENILNSFLIASQDEVIFYQDSLVAILARRDEILSVLN